MIDFVTNQPVRMKKNCLGRELSLSANLEADKDKHLTNNGGAGAGIIWSSNLVVTVHGRLKAAQRIEDSVRYMLQHLDEPLDVATLSAKAGISPSSFYALFKSATGQTPINFLIRARMRLACKLLEKTTLQIKEIAALLGYSDQFYFSRVFKTAHGVAPRDYRLRKEKFIAVAATVAADNASLPFVSPMFGDNMVLQ